MLHAAGAVVQNPKLGVEWIEGPELEGFVNGIFVKQSGHGCVSKVVYCKVRRWECVARTKRRILAVGLIFMDPTPFSRAL